MIESDKKKFEASGPGACLAFTTILLGSFGGLVYLLSSLIELVFGD